MPTDKSKVPSLEKAKWRIPPLGPLFKITIVSMVEASQTCIEGLIEDTSPVATMERVGCLAIDEILVECP